MHTFTRTHVHWGRQVGRSLRHAAVTSTSQASGLGCRAGSQSAGGEDKGHPPHPAAALTQAEQAQGRPETLRTVSLTFFGGEEGGQDKVKGRVLRGTVPRGGRREGGSRPQGKVLLGTEAAASPS